MGHEQAVWVVAPDLETVRSEASNRGGKVAYLQRWVVPDTQGAIRCHLWIRLATGISGDDNEMVYIVNIVRGKHGLFATPPSVFVNGEWEKTWVVDDDELEKTIMSVAISMYESLQENRAV